MTTSTNTPSDALKTSRGTLDYSRRARYHYALDLIKYNAAGDGEHIATRRLDRGVASELATISKATGGRLPKVVMALLDCAIASTAACLAHHGQTLLPKSKPAEFRKDRVEPMAGRREVELCAIEFSADGSGRHRAARVLTPVELKALRAIARKQRVPFGAFLDSLLSEAIATEIDAPRTSRFPKSAYRKGASRA